MAKLTIPAVVVADVIMQRLREIGVGQVFGVHDADIEDLYSSARANPEIKPVVAHHAFSAATMANWAARIGGTPAVVMTSAGGGGTESVAAALATANNSKMPVLALLGSAPTTEKCQAPFRDPFVPPTALAAVTGLCLRVSAPQDIHSALDAAEMVLARNLPVALIVPRDVQAATTSFRDIGSPSISV